MKECTLTVCLVYLNHMTQNDKQYHSKESLDTFSDDGTDLTLIRWMLSLTPDERLQVLEDHVAFLQDLRDANSAVQIPRDSQES